MPRDDKTSLDDILEAIDRLEDSMAGMDKMISPPQAPGGRSSMRKFAQIIDLLNARFPGVFACRSAHDGQDHVLEVRCADRAGYVFVYEPSQNERFLLALHDRDDDRNPEVWSEFGAEQVVRRVLPWAFPRPWTAPEPVDRKKEKSRLEKLARGLSARGHVPCQIAEPDENLLGLLTPDGRRSLERDRKSLSPRRLVQHFPWDPAGRLALKTTVLLKTYEAVRPPGRDRDVCLAVKGPERRQEEQQIRVELADLIVVNQTHRWESAPWLWTPVEVPCSELWGFETDPDQASGEDGEGRFPERTSGKRRAARSLELLDKGRIEEALSLYQVTLSEDLHRILGGERISPPACWRIPTRPGPLHWLRPCGSRLPGFYRRPSETRPSDWRIGPPRSEDGVLTLRT